MDRLKFRPIFPSFFSHQDKNQGLLEGSVPAHESSLTFLAPGYQTKPKKTVLKAHLCIVGPESKLSFQQIALSLELC